MVLYILRGGFILLATAVALLYVLPLQSDDELNYTEVLVAVGITLAISLAIILIDVMFRRKKLAVISGVFLGLVAGLVVGYALGLLVDLVGVLVPKPADMTTEGYEVLLRGVKVIIGLITSYWGITLVLQTRGDFRFVLPYVEFARQVRGNRPVLLDSSVIIDGRIVDVIETGILQGTLVVPKFVLEELQLVADSTDKLRRARGRRGLDVLQKLQENPKIDILIHEADAEGGTVDQKLVSLAQEMQARVMTNDFNLNKICTLRGVDVINLNDVAKSLRPVALPGESMTVKIVKPGESLSQGVGYLDDGTMVVVENARRMLGQEIDVTVTSTLQTSAGRMIFGRYAGSDEGEYREGVPRPAAAITGPRRVDHPRREP